MKKKIQKPFDIEAAKNGAKVETRSGKSVRIVCYDIAGTIFPILALVNYKNVEDYFAYNIEGKMESWAIYEGREDLVIVEEVEVSKFNPGDWVCAKNGGRYPWLITAVAPNWYEAQNIQGPKDNISRITIDNYFRLWTLKDAKPGDVLVDVLDHPFIYKSTGVVHFPEFPVAYCGITEEGDFRVGEEDDYWTDDRVKPATKEQRDRLFMEMGKAGYKWEAESLTLSEIQKRWEDTINYDINGYYIDNDACIQSCSQRSNARRNYNVFATERQAKSALAMARISQIMNNDKRFGGVITDKEWIKKPWTAIIKIDNKLTISNRFGYTFLAFHTMEQANLFLEENEDLVKDYYMMD